MQPDQIPHIPNPSEKKEEGTEDKGHHEAVQENEEEDPPADSEIEDGMSKRKLKKAKQKRKQMSQFEAIDKEMVQGNFQTAAEMLIEYIQTYDYEGDNNFKGVGCIQIWQGLSTSGAEWYVKAKEENLVGQNPFDLLSISLGFISLNYSNQIISYHFSWYNDLQEGIRREKEAVVGAGNLFYVNKDYSQAEMQYLRAIQLGCKLDRVYQSLAWIYCCHFELNDKGAEYAAKALELNPNNMQAQLLSCLSCPDSQLKRMRLFSLLDQFPQYYRIHYELARCSDDLEERLSSLETIFTKFNPNYTPAILFKAYLKRQNLQQARQICDQVLYETPRNDEAYWYLAKIHEDSNPNMVHSNYRISLDINPKSLCSLKHYARYLLKENKFELSLYYINRYIKHNPYDYGAVSLKGIGHLKFGRQSRSDECFAKAMNLSRSFSLSSQIDLALFLFHKKRYEEAKVNFLNIYGYESRNYEALLYLTKCCIQLKQYDEAIKWCAYIQEKEKNTNIQFLSTKAISFEKKGHYLASINVFLKYSFAKNDLLKPQIFKNYGKLPRDDIIRYLAPCLERQAKGFYFIQLGLIYVELGELNLADQAYAYALRTNDFKIDPYLKQYYGDDSDDRKQLKIHGIFPLREQTKLAFFKRKFEVAATKLYEFEGSPAN